MQNFGHDLKVLKKKNDAQNVADDWRYQYILLPNTYCITYFPQNVDLQAKLRMKSWVIRPLGG